MTCCGGPWMMLLWAFFLVAIVVGIFLLVRALGRREGDRRPSRALRGDALDVLEERYARGEIDVKEFEERRRILDS